MYREQSGADKAKWIIIFVMLAILSAGLIVTAVKLNGSIKTKEISPTAYSVGTLNAETGKYEKSGTSIYTKEYYKTEGLKTEIKSESEATYTICYYDAKKKFLSASEALTEGITESDVPDGAKYFRISITPAADEEITRSEIYKYAKLVTVSVNK